VELSIQIVVTHPHQQNVKNEISLELGCIRRSQSSVFLVLKSFGVPFRPRGATMVAWTREQVGKMGREEGC